MDCIVAFDEYKVKAGRGAGFEQTFATRKSELGLTEGFRFFALLRRVMPPDGQVAPDGSGGLIDLEDDVNYISVTIWDSLEAYEAWGGQSWYYANSNLLGKATSFVAGKLNLKEETPDEVLWQGILNAWKAWPRSTSMLAPDGWRQVSADGTNLLAPDVYVTMNRISLVNGVSDEFEKGDAALSQKFHLDKGGSGLLGFLMLRRMGFDMMGITHASFSVWKDKRAYDKFRAAEKKAERKSSGKIDPQQVTVGGDDDIFRRAPEMRFYEGVLVLEPTNIRQRGTTKKGKDCAKRSRRLEPSPKPESEQEWYAQWGENLQCWLAELAEKHRLEACPRALAAKIAERFDAELRQSERLLPMSTGTLAAHRSGSEKGCDWLTELELPSFPSLGSFEFQMPPLPNLAPWTSWGWRKWIELSEDKAELSTQTTQPPQLHSALLPSLLEGEAAASSASSSSSALWAPFVAGAGAGFGLMAVLAVGIWAKGGGAARMQLRPSSRPMTKSTLQTAGASAPVQGQWPVSQSAALTSA